MNNPESDDPFSTPESITAMDTLGDAREELALIRSYVKSEYPGFDAGRITAHIDTILVGEAEDRITGEDSAARIDEVVGLSVVENFDEPSSQAVATLEHDGYDDELTRVIEAFGTGPDATVDSRVVAESTARLVSELEAHPVMKDGPRGIEYVSADEGKPRLEHVFPVDSALVAEVAREDDEILAQRDKAGIWREAVLGTSEIESFRTDLAERFARPESERSGQALTIASGETLRPIVDIAMDSATAETVTAMIDARRQGVDAAIAALEEARTAGRPMSRSDCERLLVEMGAWSRNRGGFLGVRNDGGGTVADLYADQALLDQLNHIDTLVEAACGTKTASAERLENGVISMMAFSFAGGTELMHATPSANLAHIARDGALAPRSRQKHGAGTARNLNGAYVHMTGPGTVAYEYTDYRERGTVIGVPIETVVKHSPYLQLEGEYTGDEFIRDDETHSMQYELGKITITDLADAPDFIREALHVQRDRIAAGMRASDIGQGRYNNYTFAASGKALTAGDYEYPLDEVTVYSTEAELIKGLVADTPFGRTLGRRAVVTENGGSLGALPLVNSRFDDSVTLFAPVSAREVAFTERSAGNRSMLTMTLENVAPEAVAQHMDRLIDRGSDPSAVLEKALASARQQQGNEGLIVDAYLKNRARYEQAGVGFDDLLEMLDPRGLRALGTSLSYGLEHRIMSVDQQHALAGRYGNKLYQDFPSEFVDLADLLQSSGYRLTDEQRVFVSGERRRRQAAAEESARKSAETISSLGNF